MGLNGHPMIEGAGAARSVDEPIEKDDVSSLMVLDPYEFGRRLKVVRNGARRVCRRVLRSGLEGCAATSAVERDAHERRKGVPG